MLPSSLKALILQFFTVMLLQRTTHPLQVAVLGSGMSGATAARTLAEKGVKVTVFESGFGIGGRMSTRTTRDEFRHQFDHGAQYIGSPKTQDFKQTLSEWNTNGWVKEWKGTFKNVNGSQIIEEDATKTRFVGFPKMNSICRNLLHHENIRVKLQTRANGSQINVSNTNTNAHQNSSTSVSSCWQLTHDKTKADLGTFDWLIASDRLTGAQFRKDLSSLDEFTTNVRDIQSVKSLTAMIVFEKPLGIDIDSITFTGQDPAYGSLGWIARDSSKPGRERSDGRECWVLQSHPDAANDILNENSHATLDTIREKAKDVLLSDFLRCIPKLAVAAGNKNKNEDIDFPAVKEQMGHRWGAAFPIPTQESSSISSQIIAGSKFVACGDYFGDLTGRIEGAYLSGKSAAKQLLQCEC